MSPLDISELTPHYTGRSAKKIQPTAAVVAELNSSSSFYWCLAEATRDQKFLEDVQQASMHKSICIIAPSAQQLNTLVPNINHIACPTSVSGV